MATRTTPLMSAAALATAAAVAVATPAIAPSITSATSPVLSTAKVNLANFADLMSITASDWNYYFYTGWGGAIGQIEIDPQTSISDYWLPQCNYDCTVAGVSGLAYLALDALINGNGQGIADAPNWSVSAVNYLFEGDAGPVTALQYILEKPFLGEPYTTPGPLYNPAIASAIALVFQGGYALTTLYVTGLSLVAQAALAVPYIGEYLYRGIGSYIGPAFSSVDGGYDYSAYSGFSGVLRYLGGVITTGGNPNPYPLVQTSSASATPALAAKVGSAGAASADAAVAAASTEANTTPAESASSAAVAATTAAAAETKPADSTPADSTPADSASPVADAVTTAAPTTKPADAPKSRKRPMRDAAASVKKAVGAAVSGAAKAATGASAAS